MKSFKIAYLPIGVPTFHLEIVTRTVEEGWEPHYAVIYGDAAAELEILARMLDMEVLRF
jgi:hypothetical protein